MRRNICTVSICSGTRQQILSGDGSVVVIALGYERSGRGFLNPGDRGPIFLPRHKNQKKSSSTLSAREDRCTESSGSQRSPDPPVEGCRRGLGPEINASIWQMPVSGRIPHFVERGTDGLATEVRTLSGLAFRLSAGVPFGRGWQATGESGGGPSRVAPVPDCSRTARQSVWLPEGTVYGRRCSTYPLPGWGGRAARLRGVGCVAGRVQRLQQHPHPHLRVVVRAFLWDRSIVYTIRGGGMTERVVYRGVPQGSVLGPLLWNIAYDAVFRAPMPPYSALACYTDDTLVLIWGAAWDGTVRLAELAMARVVNAIKGLGLMVSPEKSEVMWFCRRTDHGTPPAGYRLRLEGAEIGVGTSTKYLSLTLDSHWTFGAHFERLAPSVEGTANALGRLLPWLGGPCSIDGAPASTWERARRG